MPPAPLLYPPVPDFFTAILLALGLDLHAALVWTSIPLSLALTGLFYCFAVRVLRLGDTQMLMAPQRIAWAAALATILFFLNGGLGFIDFFRDWFASNQKFWTFLEHLPSNYSHIPEKGIVWPNIITDMLLPQRSSLFGLAIALVIFSCFAIAWNRSNWKRCGTPPRSCSTQRSSK